ncbi:MAG: AraC family transcriptional regulator [Prolixibacteraceae bacterium]|nr:AraC family transcriptional regulator [Prolixibacteraceae bacterium]
MIRFFEPNNILKRYLKNYCIVEIADSTDFLPTERIYPNGNICIVFHYGYSSKFKARNSNAYIEPNLVICGQQTSYYDLSLSGKTGMILITFKPQGLRAFFNFPAKELLNENISLNLMIKNEASVLENKLLNFRNNNQRIAAIDDFFINRLAINRDFDRIDFAVKLIEHSKGQIKTQQLSQETCLGIKQFERIFTNHVGLNPKKFSSIIRFQNVIQTKNKHKKPDLNQLAINNGYYDQSHFIHDFKNLTDQSPRDFFNNKL